MLTDSNRSRSTRSLTAMTVALALAATATLAGAAGALAGKPAAEVTFSSTNRCIHGTTVSAVSATFVTTAKGHWFHYEYRATTTSSLDATSVWPPDKEIVRGDAKAESIELLGYHSFDGPVGTIFEVRPTDRKGAALGNGAWQSSPTTYSCPQ